MKRTVSLLLALLMVLCAYPLANAQTGEEIKLVVWQSAFTPSIELEKPEAEWTINKIARAFEAENPGVTIEIIYNADQAVAQNKLKAAVLAGEAPDIVNTFSGYLVTTFKDIFVDITDMIPAEDKEKIVGWEAVSENLKSDGAILGYPVGGSELGIFLYNKELVAKAGVDLEGENAPKTAQEFKDAMFKIKEAGILPILAQDGKANSLFMFPCGAWWTQQVGIERVTSNSMNTTTFSDDQAFLDALAFTASLYQEELVNQDYATIQTAFTQFMNGESALYACGNWDISIAMEAMGDNLGLYCVPSFKEDVAYPFASIGGVGQSASVLKTCAHPEMAVKFLSFINNRENAITMVKLISKLPQRTDITPEDLGWAGNPVYEKAMAACNNLFPWNDNAMQSDVMNEYYKQTLLAVIGNITPEECAQALDQVAYDAANA